MPVFAETLVGMDGEAVGVGLVGVDEIEEAVQALADMPMMGRLDPLFAHRKQAYRSIIVRRLNKVVYYVKDDTVHIAAFWDTRREPKNQAKQAR